MDPRDKAEIIKRYTDRYERYGGTVETLASGSDAHQAIRYGVLSDVDDLNGQLVLDVGCGFGGFYDYATDNNMQTGCYTGIDIVPALIAEGRRRYPFHPPDPKILFHELGILGYPDEIKYDYVVSSQAFNNRLTYSDNWEVMKAVLTKCYGLAKKGTAIDMMSTHVDSREDHLYYFDPCAVFEFCKTLTKRVVIRHDYPLFEFCIYMYPDFMGWRHKSAKLRRGK